MWAGVRRELSVPLYRNAYALMANTVGNSALGLVYWVLAARTFPDAYKSRGKESSTNAVYKPIVEWFAAGKTVDFVFALIIGDCGANDSILCGNADSRPWNRCAGWIVDDSLDTAAKFLRERGEGEQRQKYANSFQIHKSLLQKVVQSYHISCRQHKCTNG